MSESEVGRLTYSHVNDVLDVLQHGRLVSVSVWLDVERNLRLNKTKGQVHKEKGLLSVSFALCLNVMG